MSAAAPVPAAPRPPRVPRDTLADAHTLMRWARDDILESTPEGRERAIRKLSRCTVLDPGASEPWRLMGQAYELGLFGKRARDCYTNAARLAPGQPDAWLDLAWSWKRHWLRTLEAPALDSAISSFSAAARVRPKISDAWLGLVPLRCEKNDLAGAEEAAWRTRAGYPRRPEALLAIAMVAYRRGDLERADSALALARPRMDPTVRALLASPAAVGVRVTAGGGTASPWARLDPDPTTAINEVELEYVARAIFALLMYSDPLVPELDARAETYMRYGPPAKIELNPEGAPTEIVYSNRTNEGRASNAMSYACDAQVWSYPQFGMRVILQDRSLNGRYAPEARPDFDPLSVPDKHVMASRGDLISLANGAAVFPTLPPREQRLDVRAAVARFDGGRGARLVGHVQAPGGPADSVAQRWLVLDSDGREIARGASVLGVSACDPAERRVGTFSCELPPGEFQVVVSARDRQHRRGVSRSRVTVEAPPPGLAMSDIVLVCGDPSTLVGMGEVRIEANMEAIAPATRPLVAYFELTHLVAGPDGQSRFEYEYAVERVPTDRRPRAPTGALLAATREETYAGTVRRQFVSIPTQSLPAGRYRVTIRVRDLTGGGVVEGAVAFERK